MGSGAPPWMSELVARNHKIVRGMWNSNSFDSNLDEGISQDNCGAGMGEANKNPVVEPKSPTSMTATSPTTIGRTTMAAVVQEQMRRIKHNRKASTEKTSPIRGEDGGFMDEGESKYQQQYIPNGEEEGLLEYGPGIVRKLRSRYQSLALRQYASRPTLRRSASLENVLDVEGAQDRIKRETPSPTPFGDNYGEGYLEDKPDGSVTTTTSMTKSTSATAVLQTNQSQNQMYEKKTPGHRGRAAVAERRDRMRRARSVDALQRTKHEEEILEKFKAVVLPKEEIVIIEVSKPRTNGLSPSNNNYYVASAGDKAYPTQLFISPDRNTAGLTVSEISQGATRVRSFISPEHELPPHDIVRETARIFEKNQENNKKVGQALRLSKSSLQSPDSPNQSPSSPTPPTPVAKGTVMAQGNPPNNALDKSSLSSPSTPVKPVAINHGSRQIGIIRPTLANKPQEAKRNVFSPVLSPTQQPYKAFLQQHSQKPPLSPKPLFTSSPSTPIRTFREGSPGDTPSSGATQRHQNVVPKEPHPKEPLSPLASSSPSPLISVSSPPQVPVTNLKKAEAPTNTKLQTANVNAKKEQSGAELRRPLKHVPNSFTISPVPKDFSSQKPSSPSSPVKSNPTSFAKNILHAAPVENVAVRTTARITETPKVTHLSAPSEQKSITSPKVERKSAPAVNQSQNAVKKADETNSASQLRVHQKQKSTQQNGNSTMVFNFTSRSSVPDYIEDDGLHRDRLTLAGTVTDESVDDMDNAGELFIDVKLATFVGDNVIINGKSSLQRRPKSMKMNISFNETATTTYEYPSESSLLITEEEHGTDMLGHKSPNIINNSGNGLSSYTPKVGNNDYQLGTFDTSSSKKVEAKKDSTSDIIEDYLKEDSETTTWSNELTSDIMF